MLVLHSSAFVLLFYRTFFNPNRFFEHNNKLLIPVYLLMSMAVAAASGGRQSMVNGNHVTA